MIREDVKCFKSNVDKMDLIAALENQTQVVQDILNNTKESVHSKAVEKEEATTNSRCILSLICDLMNEIDQLEKDHTKSAEVIT